MLGAPGTMQVSDADSGAVWSLVGVQHVDAPYRAVSGRVSLMNDANDVYQFVNELMSRRLLHSMTVR